MIYSLPNTRQDYFIHFTGINIEPSDSIWNKEYLGVLVSCQDILDRLKHDGRWGGVGKDKTQLAIRRD